MGSFFEVFFLFLFLFLVLGSPILLICFPRNLPLERFLESPSRRCMDSLRTLRHAVLSLGRTEQGEDGHSSPLGVQPTIGSLIWGYGDDPVFFGADTAFGSFQPWKVDLNADKEESGHTAIKVSL